MKRKILSLLTAFAMVFGIIAAPFTSAKADDVKKDETTESVTVHKILTSKGNLAFTAKKVTITTGKGEEATSDSKVIVEKENKYYEVTVDENGKLSEAAITDETDFVKALKKQNLDAGKTALVEDVKFEGQIGIDGTNYDGTQINKIAKFFGEGSEEIKDVYFAFKDSQGKFITIKTDTKNADTPEYGRVDSLDVQVPDGYELLAGKTGANGITFITKGLKGEFEIDEIHENHLT